MGFKLWSTAAVSIRSFCRGAVDVPKNNCALLVQHQFWRLSIPSRWTLVIAPHRTNNRGSRRKSTTSQQISVARFGESATTNQGTEPKCKDRPGIGGSLCRSETEVTDSIYHEFRVAGGRITATTRAAKPGWLTRKSHQRAKLIKEANLQALLSCLCMLW